MAPAHVLKDLGVRIVAARPYGFYQRQLRFLFVQLVANARYLRSELFPQLAQRRDETVLLLLLLLRRFLVFTLLERRSISLKSLTCIYTCY